MYILLTLAVYKVICSGIFNFKKDRGFRVSMDQRPKSRWSKKTKVRWRQ